jgi:hypothetical protein
VRSPVLAALLAATAACGPAAVQVARAQVPGVDPVSGALATVEVELPGCDLQAVRGPAATVLLGAAADGGRSGAGATPDCTLRRSGTALAPLSSRCAGLLGAYAALERARSFLVSAGAEALPPPLVLAEARDLGEAHGLRYLPAQELFTLGSGPVGSRVPAALNPGAVTREVSRRQLRTLLELRPAEAEGLSLFLGAAASGDPGYLAASQPGGDPRGELDLSRPLADDASAEAVVASALWAWADASGDPVGAARASLAAARTLASAQGREGGPPLLSLVAEQLDGVERDQACAVFRARAGRLPACP